MSYTYYTDKDGFKHFGSARPSNKTAEIHIPPTILLKLKQGIGMKELNELLIPLCPKNGYVPFSWACSEYNRWFRMLLVHFVENDKGETIVKLINW